jgi:hypothetical protein
MQLSSLLFTTIIINLIVIKSSINAQVISNESCTDATCIIGNVGIDIAVIIDASASLTTDQFDNVRIDLKVAEINLDIFLLSNFSIVTLYIFSTNV